MHYAYQIIYLIIEKKKNDWYITDFRTKLYTQESRLMATRNVTQYIHTTTINHITGKSGPTISSLIMNREKLPMSIETDCLLFSYC